MLTRLTALVLLMLATTSAFGQAKTKKDELPPEAIALATGAPLILLICGIAVMVSFISFPILIALYRSHPDLAAISLIAIFFGWTCLGWWVALIWAVKSIPRPSRVSVNIGRVDTGADPFDFPGD